MMAFGHMIRMDGCMDWDRKVVGLFFLIPLPSNRFYSVYSNSNTQLETI